MKTELTAKQAEAIERDTRRVLIETQIEAGCDPDIAAYITDAAIDVARHTEGELKAYVTGKQAADEEFNQLSVGIMLMATQIIAGMMQQLLQDALGQAREQGVEPIWTKMGTVQ